ncbi:MAG: mechanosensitive ion channel [Helicobacteraceae bacterium]|nr:mechanosensitive ion channel [Helicobacteraceae bacterium]
MFIKLVLLVSVYMSLMASENIWDTLIAVENEHFTYLETNNLKKDDNNTENVDLEMNLFKNIDDEAKAYIALVEIMKIAPIDDSDENRYFDYEDTQKEIYRLKYKIKSNQKHGYLDAVLRDEIKIKELLIEQKIYIFLLTLSHTWTQITMEEFNNMVDSDRDAIEEIFPDDFEQLYNSAKNSKRAKMIKRNLEELYKSYAFYTGFLNYIQVNAKALSYRSFISILDLNNFIEYANETKGATYINSYLRFLHIDLGRLSLFLVTMTLTLLISFFIYIKVYSIMKKFILNSNSVNKELLLLNLKKLRKPFLILTFFFGLELSIEALLYPAQFQENGVIFYFVFITTISYMIVALIDNMFYYSMTNKSSKSMRSELLNLVLSIIKITVYFVALLLFLVKLGVNITSVLASLGIGGVAVALAAKDTLSNFFGLIKILADNSFSQGDYISTTEFEGSVVEIKFISTTIRTTDNSFITVPNSMLANAPLINSSRRSVGRLLKMNIALTYDSSTQNLLNVVKDIKDMLGSHRDIASEENFNKDELYADLVQDSKLVSKDDKLGIKTAIRVHIDELTNSSINIAVLAFSRSVALNDWLDLKQDVILRIMDIVKTNDLKFAFPTQTLHITSEKETL